MDPVYETFRDTVEWEVSLGDEQYPGVGNHAAPVEITVRKQERVRQLAGDIVSDIDFAMLPEHEPHANDLIDGAKVLRVGSVKDSAGNVRWWVAYAER